MFSSRLCLYAVGFSCKVVKSCEIFLNFVVEHLRTKAFPAPADLKLHQYQAKWMVMGFGRFRVKTVLQTIASTRLSTFICIVTLLVFFAQTGSGSDCLVEKCSDPYTRAKRRLERTLEKDPSIDFGKKQCRIQKRLHRCLHSLRRVCRGNLYYHSLKHVSDNDQRDSNCSHKSSGITPLIVNPPGEKSTANMTSSTKRPPSTVNAYQGTVCNYEGKTPHKHCGMFGDPHLRTFHDEFHTCKVEGTWPLIDNDYMVVMVTNVPVKEGSSATVTTKITVLINAHEDNTEQQYFVAASGQLPGAFTDGSHSTGSVEVVEVDPGRHVQICVRFIGATIIIRQVARYLTFAIRIPEEFIDNDNSRTQLCAQGCPAEHRISPKQDVNPFTNPGNKDYEELTSVSLTSSPYFNIPNNHISPSSTFFSRKDARLKCRNILLGLPEIHYEEDLSKEHNEHEKKEEIDAASKPSTDFIHASFKQLRAVDRKASEHNSANKKRNRRSFSDQENDPLSCIPPEKSNFYFESCVFDLMTTGDVAFASTAKAAWDDVRTTHTLSDDAPGTSVEIIRRWNPTDLQIPECDPSLKSKSGKGGAKTVTPFYLLTLLCLIASHIICVNLTHCNVTVKLTLKRKSLNLHKIIRNKRIELLSSCQST